MKRREWEGGEEGERRKGGGRRGDSVGEHRYSKTSEQRTHWGQASCPL